jgi:hypothetical protein
MANKTPGKFWMAILSRPLVNFIMVLLGIAAAYFTTIGNIRVELAEKAESGLVETLDKRLGRMEVMIKEGLVGKGEFYEMRNNIESRLGRIEFYLLEKRK